MANGNQGTLTPTQAREALRHVAQQANAGGNGKFRPTPAGHGFNMLGPFKEIARQFDHDRKKNLLGAIALNVARTASPAPDVVNLKLFGALRKYFGLDKYTMEEMQGRAVSTGWKEINRSLAESNRRHLVRAALAHYRERKAGQSPFVKDFNAFRSGAAPAVERRAAITPQVVSRTNALERRFPATAGRLRSAIYRGIAATNRAVYAGRAAQRVVPNAIAEKEIEKAVEKRQMNGGAPGTLRPVPPVHRASPAIPGWKPRQSIRKAVGENIKRGAVNALLGMRR